MFFTTVQMQSLTNTFELLVESLYNQTASQAGTTAFLHVNRLDFLEERLCCCWSYVPQPSLCISERVP